MDSCVARQRRSAVALVLWVPLNAAPSPSISLLSLLSAVCRHRRKRLAVSHSTPWEGVHAPIIIVTIIVVIVIVVIVIV
ncbi:MAG TPA: hypothetical protein VKQ36_15555, partial [Ktedonobacterales bacterium]|nr:hypothetical protein [Ktedonobacterales bacterium]